MISQDLVVAIICTIAVTTGLTWLFYPAWLAAIEEDLEWEENPLNVPQNSEIILSLVIPAYNEENRISIMLKSAHAFLASGKGHDVIQRLNKCAKRAGHPPSYKIEWIIVDDGSQDGTCKVVEAVLQSLDSNHAWRVLSLKKNSGKGAAIKIGMSSANGHFSLMVDADGATDFGPGLRNLVERLSLHMKNAEEDTRGMISVFGSRAHMQKESTTRRSFVRTLLMRAFHLFVSILVPSSIRDTQCGFKLFTKDAAQAVFGNLHLRRWAFDTEVVLLCNHLRIDMLEVPVPWQEIDGSKLNTSKLALAFVSVTMLRDMMCVRVCYSLNIWKTPGLNGV